MVELDKEQERPIEEIDQRKLTEVREKENNQNENKNFSNEEKENFEEKRKRFVCIGEITDKKKEKYGFEIYGKDKKLKEEQKYFFNSEKNLEKGICYKFIFNTKKKYWELLNFYKLKNNREEILLNEKNQIILYGPAGTGKTFSTKQIIEGHSKTTYEYLKKNGQVEFITFHQSFAYEEFIEGIKPDLDGGEKGEIKYKIENGIFKDICKEAKENSSILSKSNENEEKTDFEQRYGLLLKEIDNSKNKELNIEEHTTSDKIKRRYEGDKESLKLIYSYKYIGTVRKLSLEKEEIKKYYLGIDHAYLYEGFLIKIIKKLKSYPLRETKQDLNPYYLIIDEINRGNISKILGELITLLEKDKRLGGDEEITTKLPYSKEDFGVPPNLFIIGTMNTSDKSIANLDIALRRRFGFIEMFPNSDLISEEVKIKDKTLKNIFEELNKNILFKLDKDHLIGHSFFMKVDSLENFKFVMYYEILPLLEEYFYNNFEDIKEVLKIAGLNLFEIFYKEKELKRDGEEDIKKYLIKKYETINLDKQVENKQVGVNEE